MAIPPSTSEQLPMVVAQTPMSPDHLVPAIHSAILQSPHRPSLALSDISTDASSIASELSTFSSGASSSFSHPGYFTHEAVNSGSNTNSSAAQRSSTSTGSSTSASPLLRRSSNGKENCAPLSSRRPSIPDADRTPTRRSVERQPATQVVPPVSPPSSPPTRRARKDNNDTLINRATSTTSTHALGVAGERQKSFPSPPPSPTIAGNARAQHVRVESQHGAIHPSVKTRTTGSNMPCALPMLPTGVSRFSFPRDAEGSVQLPQIDTTSCSVKNASCENKSPSRPTKHIHAIPAAEKRHDIVLEFTERHHDHSHLQEQAFSPHTGPVHSRLLTEDQVAARSDALALDKSIGVSNGKMGMVEDTSGFSTVPSSSLLPPHKPSKGCKWSMQVKNAPWAWHQDGIHRQRLESHQILTKEQVFELFRLDLDQDGPNGFFLFKLVKKFKRQDTSVLGVSSSVLDAEISASPTSSPSSASPSTSFLDSIDAVSVSQRLKRQLLLQMRKKQRKASAGDSDEDENLEALLNMSSHNTSLQSLNLQEVIDAYDSLKKSDGWGSLVGPSRESTASSRASTQEQPLFPDSDGEYTSRDKAVDTKTLERRRGVYTTGRLDGMNLMSKKRFKALQRRSSLPARKASTGPASRSSSGPNGNDSLAEATPADGPQQFKKQAVSQLHIYSKNGLKFKFDVMEDNELHFVEASKKYTFMDPLAAHQQPRLDLMASSASVPALHQQPGHNDTRRITSVTTHSGPEMNRTPRHDNSTKGRSSVSSSGHGSGSRRVFVTRLGRHTLLTYSEYKTLTKSASSFTLGAKLLLQRSIAVATPSFYGSSSSGASSQEISGRDKDLDQSNQCVSPTSSTPMSASNGDGTDYFSVKKKQRVLPGFASKTVAAIRSPSTPTGSSPSSTKTARSIVTPYNPAEYKSKSLTLSTSPPSAEAPDSEAHTIAVAQFSSQVEKTAGLRRRQSSSDMGVTSSPTEFSPPSPATSSSTMSTSSNPYSAPPIRRQGNQAGLKFQHLFATVHQRLQKLELDSGGSFYRSPLVQWTVIEDVAELRWWRDKVGIQMIGHLPGDGDDTTMRTLVPCTSGPGLSQRPWGVERSSFVSTQSYISDASSSSGTSSSSGGYRSKVSVERLGYRFLRVSGHMGTLKVTVSEQVEARAVALAVKAEMLRQQTMAHPQPSQQQQQQQQGLRQQHYDETGRMVALEVDQPWVEMSASLSDADSDSDAESDAGSDTDSVLDPVFDLGKQARAAGDGDDSCNKGRTRRNRTNGKPASFNFYDAYEYDEWTGRLHLKKVPCADRFSRRGRHDRKSIRERSEKVRAPLIERMTMIASQTKAFKGDCLIHCRTLEQRHGHPTTYRFRLLPSVCAILWPDGCGQRCMGAGYGTFKSGIGIAGMGTFRPELMMKALIPVVMAGIISVYGLVISVLIAGSLSSSNYSLYAGFVHLGAGLCVGLTGLVAGYAIGIVGDVCVRGYAYQPRLFVAMVLVLIFAEVLGLYGLIVGLILNTKAGGDC
ncbi:unnamed protein product [Mortierella alpina]